jgi:hypothetical protein
MGAVLQGGMVLASTFARARFNDALHKDEEVLAELTSTLTQQLAFRSGDTDGTKPGPEGSQQLQLLQQELLWSARLKRAHDAIAYEVEMVSARHGATVDNK